MNALLEQNVPPTTAGEQAFGGESEAAADRCDCAGAPPGA